MPTLEDVRDTALAEAKRKYNKATRDHNAAGSAFESAVSAIWEAYNEATRHARRQHADA